MPLIDVPPSGGKHGFLEFLHNMFMLMAAAAIVSTIVAVILLVLQIFAIRTRWRSLEPSRPAVTAPAEEPVPTGRPG